MTGRRRSAREEIAAAAFVRAAATPDRIRAQLARLVDRKNEEYDEDAQTRGGVRIGMLNRRRDGECQLRAGRPQFAGRRSSRDVGWSTGGCFWNRSDRLGYQFTNGSSQVVPHKARRH